MLKMNKSWDEERKEISVWLSGYFGMVKLWVDKILDNEDHDVNKNKILAVLTTWISYLEDERQKIMMLKDVPTESIGPGDEDTPQSIETNEYGDDDWATPSKELDKDELP